MTPVGTVSRRTRARWRGTAIAAEALRRAPIPRPAAVRRVAAAAFLVLIAASPPAAATWQRPVSGAVSRPFAYSAAEPFAAGRHRGVDLSGRVGAAVRAACSGRVVFAGRDVVTLRCGPWRVTHLPVAVAVREGDRVREGARIGTLLASADHAGLHLGVRRAGDRFGYVDPLPFLAGAKPPVPIPVPRRGPETRAPRPAPPQLSTPPAAPPQHSPPAPARLSRPAPAQGVRVPPDRRIAPWPVWVGLALALFGAAGGGVRVRAQHRRPVAEPVGS